MTKARRMMQEDMKLIDLVIELTDARAPLSGRNPDIDQLARGKYRILLLNKADLADERANELWKEYFGRQGISVRKVNAKSRSSLAGMQQLVFEACAEKITRDRRRGILNRPIRAMVAGIPNVGKSTFINSLTGRSAAKTGNKPGVTRGKQWIRLNDSIELLDTPGILWPKFDDPLTGTRLAAVGCIKNELLMAEELAMWLLRYMQTAYPGAAGSRYMVEETGDCHLLLQRIALAMGCRMQEGEPDLGRAASMVIDDFRSGKTGRMSLEFPATDNVSE